MTKEKLLQIIENEDECLWVEYKIGFPAYKFSKNFIRVTIRFNDERFYQETTKKTVRKTTKK